MLNQQLFDCSVRRKDGKVETLRRCVLLHLPAAQLFHLVGNCKEVNIFVSADDAHRAHARRPQHLDARHLRHFFSQVVGRFNQLSADLFVAVLAVVVHGAPRGCNWTPGPGTEHGGRDEEAYVGMMSHRNVKPHVSMKVKWLKQPPTGSKDRWWGASNQCTSSEHNKQSG